jgi:hypothetical protein
MFAEFMTAMQSLKVATEIANGLVGLKTSTEIHTKVTELNAKILSAQQDLFTANATHAAKIEEVRELKEQIARMEKWDAQKKRYKLVPLYPGSVAYALQKAMSEGEPAHYLCTRCYEDSKRSIMQRSQKHASYFGVSSYFICPACKTEIDVGVGAITVRYAEDIAGG